MSICVIDEFARGPYVRCASNERNPKFCSQITGTSSLIVLFVSCNFDLLADWRVNKYEFIMLSYKRRST